MLPRTFALGLAVGSFVCAACGGTPRAATADLAAIHQPTPDPTLDAVVRDLPRVLAGVLAPTPTPSPPVLKLPTPKPKPPSPASPTAPAPTLRPTPRPTVPPKPRA